MNKSFSILLLSSVFVAGLHATVISTSSQVESTTFVDAPFSTIPAQVIVTPAEKAYARLNQDLADVLESDDPLVIACKESLDDVTTSTTNVHARQVELLKRILECAGNKEDTKSWETCKSAIASSVIQHLLNNPSLLAEVQQDAVTRAAGEEKSGAAWWKVLASNYPTAVAAMKAKTDEAKHKLHELKKNLSVKVHDFAEDFKTGFAQAEQSNSVNPTVVVTEADKSVHVVPSSDEVVIPLTSTSELIKKESNESLVQASHVHGTVKHAESSSYKVEIN